MQLSASRSLLEARKIKAWAPFIMTQPTTGVRVGFPGGRGIAVCPACVFVLGGTGRCRGRLCTGALFAAYGPGSERKDGGRSATVKLVEGQRWDGWGWRYASFGRRLGVVQVGMMGLAGPLSMVLLICARNTTAHQFDHPLLHECVWMMESVDGHAGLGSSRALPLTLTPPAVGAERRPASRLRQHCNKPRPRNGERSHFHEVGGMCCR